jgi:hypothetical protein
MTDVAQLASSLQGLSARMSGAESAIAALQDGGADSIAVPNNLYLTDVGVVGTGQSGFAILENTREPGPLEPPGSLEYELMNSEGIKVDTIGAMEKAGTLTVGGLFHNVPTPYLTAGPGVVVVHPKSYKPTLQEREPGKLWSDQCNGFQMYQLRGESGHTAKVKLKIVAEHFGLVASWYDSTGAHLSNSFGEATAQVFPADGILFLILADTSVNLGIYEPPEPGVSPFEIEITESKANPFEFPTFKLFEGFMYIVSAAYTFKCDSAAAASGLVVATVALELFPPEDPVELSSGTSYSFVSDTLLPLPAEAGEATPELAPIEPEFEVEVATIALVPAGQENGYASGGVQVKKHPDAPGNATGYTWTKQRVVIQQLKI